MKFVHAADLHIDSPLRGLERYDGAPVERARLATRMALENLVDLCIKEEVAFLVVAGDLFDFDWRDFNTAHFVVNQFQRLKRLEIPIFVIRGNHDSRDEMSYKVPWPDNLKLLDHRKPETVIMESLGVAIHGMSFPKRELKENLVPLYPKPIDDLLNIGLLHTNATGSLDHDPYAPCGLDELCGKDYNYWALGHIHKRETLHEFPHVVYPGNTQGRHVRERGEKGCVLVTVADGEISSLEFRPTDVLRWRRETLDLEPDDGIDDLHDKVEARLRAIADEVDGRLTAVRLEVQGRCRAHQRLTDEARRDEAIAHIRALPGEFTDNLWVEKIKLDTRIPLDLDKLRRGQDLLGDLLRAIDEIADDDQALLKFAADAEIQKLAAKTRVSLKEDEPGLKADEINYDSPEQIKTWLRMAENDLLSRLTEQLP